MRLTFEDYVLDAARRELWRGAEPVAIEPQVFDLLAHLVQNPDRVVTRDELLQSIWDGRFVSESAIANRVNGARRAIGDSGDAQRLIRTVPRKGFRFIGAVNECEAELPAPALPAAVPRRWASFSALAGGALVLLSAAIAVLLLWPGTGATLASALRMLSGPRPTTVSSPAPGQLPRLTIAVLPLTAFASGSDQPNLAAGLTEVLTTELSRYRSLLVTSRQTAAAYVQKVADAKQIGRELGVRYIIDGSVEQAGGQIRVNARLADAETGTYLWAYRYDRPAGDPLDVEDEIVGQAVNGVRRAITFSEAERREGNLDAAQLIWRGRALTWADSREKQAAAARIFDRALEIAPSSLPAKFGFASALAQTGHGLFNANDPEKLHRAQDLIDGALPAVPQDAGAHYTRGQVLRLQGRLDEAIREFEMAIALDHNFATAYAMLGWCKLMTGALAEVAPLEERAIRLDPLSPGIGNWYRRIGMAELLQSHTETAIAWFEKARAADATWQSDWIYQTYSELAAAYALNGETGRSADALAEARKTDEYPVSIAQYCRQMPACANPKMRALAEPTYLKGLRLAGLPDE